MAISLQFEWQIRLLPFSTFLSLGGLLPVVVKVSARLDHLYPCSSTNPMSIAAHWSALFYSMLSKMPSDLLHLNYLQS